MVLDPQTNFGRTGVTSSIASTDTTISVTDASVVSDPATGSFNVVIFDAAAGAIPSQVGSGSREIVTVTGRDATNDTLTVTRGAEGTGATSLPDTSVVIEGPTGGDFDAVDAALESVASYSGGTADHLTAQVGASSNRQDVFGGAIVAQSLNSTTRFASVDADVQPAIDDLDGKGGGTVFIQDDISQSTMWEVPANVRIIGVGFPTVTVNHSDRPFILRDSSGDTTQSARETNGTDSILSVGVSNLRFEDGGSSSNLLLMGFQYCEFQNLRFQGMGVELRGIDAAGGGVYYNVFNNVRVWNSSTSGWYAVGQGRGVNDNYFYGCQAASCDQRGFYLDGSAQSPVVGNIMDISAENNNVVGGSSQAEVRLGASDGNLMRIYVESNTVNAIGLKIDGSADNNIISGRMNASSLGSPNISLANAGQDNKILVGQMNTRITTASDGIANKGLPFSLDAKPSVFARGESGEPVENLGFATDGSGNYTGISVRVLNYDGTNKSAEVDVSLIAKPS